jgi:hypothetical protein
LSEGELHLARFFDLMTSDVENRAAGARPLST